VTAPSPRSHADPGPLHPRHRARPAGLAEPAALEPKTSRSTALELTAARSAALGLSAARAARRAAPGLIATRSVALGLIAALGLTGCSRDPAPSPAEPIPTPTEPAEPAPEAACRDWSTLDTTQLAPLTEARFGEHAPLLDAVWRRVLEKHYDPTLGCLDWGAKREQYARMLVETATDAQAYAVIAALLRELGQSHLRLYPPSRTPDVPGPTAPDLTVRWVEDQLVVVRSRADGPQGPVLPGSVLHAIDDHPVQPWVDEVRGRAEPHAFPREVARAAAVRLSCERDDPSRKLKVTNPAKDGRMAVRVVPCIEPEGERVTLGNLRGIPTRVEHRALGGEVGLLAFNVWMLPMVKQVQAGMETLRAEGMRALVLDLRGNPGGVGAMSVPVARMLLSKEASLGTLRFRDFEQHLNVEPGDDPFTGPVAVLVDESTASTSEIFVVGLRDHGRITVVGARPSAGAALPSVIEQVPGGALLQTVVADYHSPEGTVVEGEGIVPDVVVTETQADFEAGRDPVLEAARAHLVQVLAEPPAEPLAEPLAELLDGPDGTPAHDEPPALGVPPAEPAHDEPPVAPPAR